MRARSARLLRGMLAASVATLIAVFSHVAGGGDAPSLAAVVISFALSVLVCMLVAARTPSLWRTAVSVAVSQFLFHGLFGTMGAAPATSGTTVAHSMADMAPTVFTPALGSAAGSTQPSVAMWIAHAIAAMITIAAFSWGERAVHGLASLALLALGALARRVPVLALAGEPTRRASRLDRTDSELAHDTVALFTPLAHRGPPAAA